MEHAVPVELERLNVGRREERVDLAVAQTELLPALDDDIDRRLPVSSVPARFSYLTGTPDASLRRLQIGPEGRQVLLAAYDAISKRKVSKTFRTLGEARRWHATAQTQAAKGVRLAGTAQTLLDAAEALVDGIASGSICTKTGERYKPSVVREYERSLRLHILPTLGGAKLSKLQRRDVQRLVDELLESGADPSTIRNALKPLQVIYRRAIENGDLAINPCERLRLPAACGRRERIAAPTEAAALIAALRLEDRALWGCAFYAGLRRGELRALLWSDVDLAGGLIRVECPSSSRSATCSSSTSSSLGKTRALPSARARRDRSRRPRCASAR